MRYIFFQYAKRVMSSRVIVIVIISPCIPTLYTMYLSVYKVIGLSVYVFKRLCVKGARQAHIIGSELRARTSKLIVFMAVELKRSNI